MALDMTPEQKAVGKDNFNRVVGQMKDSEVGRGPTRRRFLQGLVAAGATIPVSAAAYFGYSSHGFPRGMTPVKAGIIGCGDEGGVLVGFHNPNFVDFIAASDIRPSNCHRTNEGQNRGRIFTGQAGTPRLGFNAFREHVRSHYNHTIDQHIRVYDDYKQLLANDDIELVVIALPLHLHAQVSIEAMRAGKHVLCEKLMGWNIKQCKEMIRVSDETGKFLAVGHQRHYSMLYAHVNEIVTSGVLGDVKHIRALWHRNNTRPNPDAATRADRPILDSWRPAVPANDRQALEASIRQHGYKSMEELIRWRLYMRTGGGLMAELGSHQLDACSIFLGKKRPIAVTAVGGKDYYRDDREVEDHVYCTFEFPGENYDPRIPARDDKGHCNYNDIITVTYSSINTNGFEKYGECVMGSKGTLVVEEEQAAYLYGIQGRATQVTATAAGGPAIVDASSTAPPERQAGAPAQTAAAATGATALGSGAPSRGYREEMEHLAYLIRMRGQGMSSDEATLKPRCDGRAAMADAIIALTANQAMKHRRRIEFQNPWFDDVGASSAVPDDDMVEERI